MQMAIFLRRIATASNCEPGALPSEPAFESPRGAPGFDLVLRIREAVRLGWALAIRLGAGLAWPVLRSAVDSPDMALWLWSRLGSRSAASDAIAEKAGWRVAVHQQQRQQQLASDHSQWSNSRVTSPIAIFSRTASATWPVEG